MTSTLHWGKGGVPKSRQSERRLRDFDSEREVVFEGVKNICRRHL